MAYRPEKMTLPAAIAEVRKRLKISPEERDTVRDAIRENALPLHVRVGDKFEPRDGAWFGATNVWWPNSLVQTFCQPDQVSVFDIMVATSDLDSLWPDHDGAVPVVSLAGMYLSPFLQVMIDAIKEHKISAEQFPKKDELVAFFLKKKLPDGNAISKAQAEYLATFCRPLGSMKGGNKRMG